MSISRRSFVAGTLAAGASLSLTLGRRGRVLGASNEVRVAVCGVHARGDTHIDWASNVPGVRVVAICDVDKAVLAMRADRMSREDRFKGRTVEQVQDFRRLLDRKDIDVISVATPNHWHALLTIMAIQAGKDVYVEKPVCHEIWEGRQMIDWARKQKRIVQAGTQSRSMHGMFDMIKYIRSGQLGKIKHISTVCYKPRGPIGKRSTPLPIPASVDYDLWCGPAQKLPLYRNQLHYDWHWEFNTGNGDIGNQGVHELDRARWFLDEPDMPPKVMSIGGRFGYEDASDTPNTQVSILAYNNVPIISEVRGLPSAAKYRTDPAAKKTVVAKDAAIVTHTPRSWSLHMDNLKGARVGVVVECEGGSLVNGSYESGAAFDTKGKRIQSFHGGGDHYGNFIKAVRSRDYHDLNADVEVCHVSTGLAHLANTSYRLGKDASPDEARDRVKFDHDYSEHVGKILEHLKANEVDLKATPLQMGPLLNFDAKTEHFTGNDSDGANALLKRKYRKPFVVPEA